MRGARLACVKPAASVRSEPGSNSHVENSIWLPVTLEIDENFTHPTSSPVRRRILLSKRDRHISCPIQPVSQSNRARHRRPRFSLFQSSIVKEQTSHPGQIHRQILNLPVKEEPVSKSIRQPFQETSSSVASSAAALVSDRLIELPTKNSQLYSFKKITQNDK